MNLTLKKRKGFVRLALKHGWVSLSERPSYPAIWLSAKGCTLKPIERLTVDCFSYSASLVPVISFGENEVVNTLHKENSSFNRIQERIIKLIGYPLPVFSGDLTPCMGLITGMLYLLRHHLLLQVAASFNTRSAFFHFASPSTVSVRRMSLRGQSTLLIKMHLTLP